jgi:hypothetical protein
VRATPAQAQRAGLNFDVAGVIEGYAALDRQRLGVDGLAEGAGVVEPGELPPNEIVAAF